MFCKTFSIESLSMRRFFLNSHLAASMIAYFMSEMKTRLLSATICSSARILSSMRSGAW